MSAEIGGSRTGAGAVAKPRGPMTDTPVPTTQAQSRRATYPGFRATLKLVGTGPRGSRDLSFEEARGALGGLLRGEATSAQAGAFLIATRIKGESPDELAGYAQALRDAARPLRTQADRPLVACAGAYDGSVDAPHLSLAAAVVAAACGAGIALHCGSPLGPKHGVTARDVLAELGGPRSPTPSQSEAMLARSGVTLIDTSRVLAGWNALRTLRNEIGLRGPVHSGEKLIDYFGARRFVVGYTHSPYAPRLLGALELLGAERAVAVRGTEGSDVVRPARPVAQDLSGPLELPARPGTAGGQGGAVASAQLTEAILTGLHRGPERDAVILSAALRLYAAGLVDDARDGLDPADRAICDGGARATLQAMING
ncbi:MAG: anthranilate phosphoribosyltransferase [Solirubrobacteraceae bacterium]